MIGEDGFCMCLGISPKNWKRFIILLGGGVLLGLSWLVWIATWSYFEGAHPDYKHPNVGWWFLLLIATGFAIVHNTVSWSDIQHSGEAKSKDHPGRCPIQFSPRACIGIWYVLQILWLLIAFFAGIGYVGDIPKEAKGFATGIAIVFNICMWGTFIGGQAMWWSRRPGVILGTYTNEFGGVDDPLLS